MSAALSLEQAFITLGGREILHSAGITLNFGRVTGLLGSNGSGKSTMLRILFGSRQGHDAIISLNNQRLKAPAYTIKGLVNYLPQFTMLPSGIRMDRLCGMFGISGEELLGYFPELASELGCTATELSGGKVRLWQALLLLLAPTQFSLLDEPFTHLSPVYVDVLKTMILHLRARKGILVTDHMYAPLLEISEELWFMKSGQSMLLRHPEDLVLHGYIRAGILDREQEEG